MVPTCGTQRLPAPPAHFQLRRKFAVAGQFGQMPTRGYMPQINRSGGRLKPAAATNLQVKAPGVPAP